MTQQVLGRMCSTFEVACKNSHNVEFCLAIIGIRRSAIQIMGIYIYQNEIEILTNTVFSLLEEQH